MSWLIAGIAMAGSLMSDKGASGADKEADDIAKFQDLIDVERMAGDVALNELNTRRGLANLESEQVAMASAMGKTGEGAGFERMQDVGREDMEDNFARQQSEVSRARKYGKISAGARDRASDAKAKQRYASSVTSGLMSFSKAFE